VIVLTVAVILAQIVSAGSMALRMGMPAREALTVGVGMCGRAELAFILASLALAQGAIDQIGKKVDIVLDGGTTPGGEPSTVLDLSGEEFWILRSGPVSGEDILKVLRG